MLTNVFVLKMVKSSTTVPSLVFNIGDRSRLIRRFVYGLCFAILFSTGPVFAAQLAEQTLRYSVLYRGSDAGELEIVIKRNDEGYRVTSISHLSPLAQMLLKGHTIESDFDLVDGCPRLIGGREFLKESGELKREFNIDYTTNTVHFSHGDPIQFGPDLLLDADAFPLGLVLSCIDTIANQQLLTISPKRARLLTYQAPVDERLQTANGDIEAIRIVATREDNPENLKTIWLRKTGERNPVKIVSGKPDKLTIIELIE